MMKTVPRMMRDMILKLKNSDNDNANVLESMNEFIKSEEKSSSKFSKV